MASPSPGRTMNNLARISLLREALDAGDIQGSLTLLGEIHADGYPKALLRPVLASCHPGLDACYLDLQLVPAQLLLARRFPAALDPGILDLLKLQLQHGCDPATFVAMHLNGVLRGDRRLYPGLPAIEIRHYQQLAQLSAGRRSWLEQLTALECLALEAGGGVEAPGSALGRWAPSHLDQLLEQRWIWIQGPGQHQGALLSQPLAVNTVRVVTDAEQASALIHDAARWVLAGGARYLVWNHPEPPSSSWGPFIRGLTERRCARLCQIGETAQGVSEIHPVRFCTEPALLAIDANWLARRDPSQLLAFLRHWLEGPPALSRPRLATELLRPSEAPLRPTALHGVLVLAANSQDVQRLGREQLEHRATVRALEGGFTQGALLELDAQSGPAVEDQLARLGSPMAGPVRVLAFIGSEDQPAPGAWDQLARCLAWQSRQLVCSDEELLWCDEPVRIGQRQFAGAPTPFRLLTRGHLPGLVALPVEDLNELQLQPTYRSLHALLKDLGLQWLELRKPITTLPQALLRRSPRGTPSALAISTADQRDSFSGDQLLELERISCRRSRPWLLPADRLEPGPLGGSFRVRRTFQPDDRVSVIIPFRDQARLTRACVLSLLKQAGPTPLELVLVDNSSTEPAAVELAASLAPLAHAHGIPVVGVRDDSPFNFAALNNRARRHCTGNFLLFLNNDIRFESPKPVEALLDPFGMALTGAVSARLLYEDGTIQHHGLAAAARQPHDILSPGKGLRPGVETEPFAVLELQEQWSAATAACLLMRIEDFDRLGGFDETFAVAYNDVDLCWRLTGEGRAVIVTPEPRIIHAESKSRGDDIAGEKRNRLARESGALRRRYPVKFQQGDPLYHRFFGPASHRFEPMEPPPQRLAASRERLLYSWVRPDFRSGERSFLIYVHWDAAGRIRPDILEQLRGYQRHAHLAFVSAAPALLNQPAVIDSLHDLCDIVLVRQNEGYDFGSWQAGLSFCRAHLQRVPRLILTNDSCYGPLHSLDSLFERLSASRADVVGLTESTAIRSHLQSYFMAYGPRVLRSALFWQFWDQIGIWPSKIDLVRACEVGWSGILADAGFRLEALYLAGEHGNVTHTHWRLLLEELEFPFLKTELLRLNPIRQNIADWQEVAARINPGITSMISDHLARQEPP